VAREYRLQLLRLDEPTPVMQVGVEDARWLPVLHQLDGDQFAQPRAVDGVEEVDASRFEGTGSLRYDAIEIVDVLQDVTAVREVETGIIHRQRFPGAHPIVDLETRPVSVCAGRLKRRRGWVDARDPAPEPGKLLCQESSTTANIERGHATWVDLQARGQHVPEVAESARVEAGEQHRQRLRLIPPRIRVAVVVVVVDRQSMLLFRHSAAKEGQESMACPAGHLLSLLLSAQIRSRTPILCPRPHYGLFPGNDMGSVTDCCR
jgi:hypothetical protein